MHFIRFITLLPQHITRVYKRVLFTAALFCTGTTIFGSDTTGTFPIDALAAPVAPEVSAMPRDSIDTLQKVSHPVEKPAVANTKRPNEKVSPDTATLQLLRDSLIVAETDRRRIFYPAAESYTSTPVDSRALFTSDATSWHDVRAFKQSFIAPRTGIAHSFNRMLFMGNTAPGKTVFAGLSLIPAVVKNPYSAEFISAPHAFSSASYSADGTLFLNAYPGLLVSPETSIFWENGVFNESILSFKTTRLISRKLQMSVFSHYQFFKDMKYNHDGNDIYTLYSSISPDTTQLSDHGYNPLVKEFTSGIDVAWQGDHASLFTRITYRDCNDEIPLDRAFTDNHPVHARITQFPLMIQTRYQRIPSSISYFTAETRIVSNRQIIKRTISSPGQVTTPQRLKLQTNDMTGAIKGGVLVNKGDSIDLTGMFNRYSIGAPDSVTSTSNQFRPSLGYRHSIGNTLPWGTVALHIGSDLFAAARDTAINLTWDASMSVNLFKSHCTLYAEHDVQHYYPRFDDLDTGNVMHDAYVRTGVSIERAFSQATASIGYQYYLQPDIAGISRSWMNGTPPYGQPQSVLMLATTIGRYHGLGFDSRVLISDTKPFVKLHNELSYLVFPQMVKQSVEITLGVDYWSLRDTTLFADTSLWNREIVDVNFGTTVHIKAFRMFYKIDNLLNRNFSYLPGYFAPGITFRWGFSWFIQR